MKKRDLGILAISIIALSIVVLGVYTSSPASASSTLTLYYWTDNNHGGSGGVQVTGLSVYVKTTGGGDVASAGGVSGSVTFSVADGEYNVISVKGAYSRTDTYTVSGATSNDVPCGLLDLYYYGGMDRTNYPVNGLSVYVKKTGGGDVASAGGVSGHVSFALLATDGGTYDVISVKGAFSRTDTVLTVNGLSQYDILSGLLTLNYYGGMDGSTGPVSGLSVYVKTTGNGDVDSRGGVSGTTSFALLAGDYKIISVKGAYSRTDTYTVAGATPQNVPCGLLTLYYYGGMDRTNYPVNGLSVYVKTTGNGNVDSRGGVSGTTSFALLAGDYNVISVKGAYSRTDTYTVSGPTPQDVPCGLLDLYYYTNNDGTGDPVSGLSVYVKKTGGGDVASAGGVSGHVSFALLATDGGTYDIISVKGAFSRTDTVLTVSGAGTKTNIPCGKLIVTYYANNNPAWGMTGVSVYVKTNGGDVESRGGVNGQTSFALLATTGTGKTYSVISVKGASSRTETGVTVSSAQTLDVPVARFRVMVVKSDFSPQTGVSVYVKTNGNGDVVSAGGVSGYVDFSLFQSSGAGGAGAYKFIAVKGSSTAQTTANADECPPSGPPGLAGVILMVP